MKERYTNSQWYFRNILITILFLTIIIYFIFHMIFNLFIVIIIFSYILLLITGKRETLILYNSKEIVIEKKSFVSFFDSKEIIKKDEIKSLRLISDQTSNERGWLLTKNKIRILEITYKEKNIYRFKHPKIIEIKKKIELMCGGSVSGQPLKLS